MKLSDVKGFGEKRIAKLAECGIYDPLDLLLLFPKKYYDRRAVIDWSSLENGEEVIFKGNIIGKPISKRINKGLSFVKAKFSVLNSNIEVTCTWFNQTYVFRQLFSVGEKLICGRVKKFGKSIEITSPQILSQKDIDVMPIYKLPKGLTQTVMYDAVKNILERVKISGYISEPLARKHGVKSLTEAFRSVHFPRTLEEAEESKTSVALENLTYTLAVYALAKNTFSTSRLVRYANNIEKLNDAINTLPFKLTLDQQKAISSIVHGFHSENRMNLMLQGDLGSGKTIVAFLSAYYATLSGYQCAIMAPTEILASQHYEKALEFFKDKGKTVRLLTGSMKSSERARAYVDIENGVADVIIGTHAIIGKGVNYANLALTIVDEQHRFGVCQRGSLENKSETADNIVMTATPIPRTLALSLYGQLDTVALNSRPNESNVKTAVVPERKLGAMYEYIEKKSNAGEKTYIVCPRIESDSAVSAVGLYEELSRGALKNVKLALLHGSQKESEKLKVMNSFANGDTSVLVSTTVIEVGIDVKEATTMVIFGADYFGLSQLHQLRGRIGRDGRESYCFIVQSDKISDRISYLCECSDGFKLAEYDFDARGAGDFLGTRQHGKNTVFAGVKINAELIKKAKSLSDDLLKDDNVRKLLSAGASEKSEFIKTLSLN